MREIKVPVTRIEGHGLITVELNHAGKVNRARFHVTEGRGFERFCQGRTLWEMPAITARTCGICPVSHLLCSAKAGDAILAVRPPRPADKLRRLMNLGQYVQSHALSFFHLSSPDLLLGWDSDPARRNVFGLAATNPQLALDGIRLRAYGQELIASLGERRVHPAWAVPGGVQSPAARARSPQSSANDLHRIQIHPRAARSYSGRARLAFRRDSQNGQPARAGRKDHGRGGDGD